MGDNGGKGGLQSLVSDPEGKWGGRGCGDRDSYEETGAITEEEIVAYVDRLHVQRIATVIVSGFPLHSYRGYNRISLY
jgi:hypothetical protein